MIVTITPNPALDVTYPVDRLEPGETHRVSGPVRRAGGKGVNVASVLADLGEASIVLAPVGGRSGEELAADLDRRGLRHALIESPVATRTSVAVTDSRYGATVFNESGEPQPESVWESLLETLRDQLTGGRVTAVTVSGSTPPDTPVDCIARIVTACQDAGCPVLLDISGELLTAALATGPALVKPNAAEATATTGEQNLLRAATALLDGGARAALISDGERGLTALDRASCWRAQLDAPVSGNPTGAGDALTASLARAFRDGTIDWPGALPHAVATAAAAVLQPVAGTVDPADIDRLIPHVILEEQPCP